MDNSLKVGIIGNGNVGTFLYHSLVYHKVKIGFIAVRKKNKSIPLDLQIPVDNLSSIKDIDILILAVNDDAIEDLVKKISVKENIVVVHTSGTKPLEVLAPVLKRGVCYPLQTINHNLDPKEKINWLIEGLDNEALTLIRLFVEKIDGVAYELNSKERAQVHLTAVIGCNFAYHLQVFAKKFLLKNKIPPELLNSLFITTLNKAIEQPSFTNQTGPAIRGDEQTIKKHLKLLSEYPAYQNVYEQISKLISNSK